MSTRLRPRRAFTLVEMVIVMVIMGIVALAVAPSLWNNPPTDGAGIATPLVNILRASQRAAADSGRSVRLTIDPSTNRYRADLAGLDAPLATGIIDMAGVFMQSDSARATFVFYPSGRTFTDSLRLNGQGHVAFVTVNPWTGAPDVRQR